MLINLRNALMTGKRLPYDAEVEYLRVDAVGPYIVIDGMTYCDAVGTYYAFTISSGGVVTHDLIPVRRGNTGYMYDLITNKLFGNVGTGDFVLGPDVVPVEYIESHGTEWVNIYTFTGSETSLRYNIDFVITQNNSSAQDYVLGVSSSGNVGPRLLKYRTNFWYSCDTGSAVVGQPASLNQRYDIDFTYNSDGTIESIINGGAIRTYQRTFYSSQGKFNYLFGLMGNSTYGMIGRVYRMKMWVDATPIHSFLPVRVGTDATSWEGAMMDVLTRRIYRNQGTGAFTYGNDLKYPIPAA